MNSRHDIANPDIHVGASCLAQHIHSNQLGEYTVLASQGDMYTVCSLKADDVGAIEDNLLQLICQNCQADEMDPPADDCDCYTCTLFLITLP